MASLVSNVTESGAKLYVVRISTESMPDDPELLEIVEIMKSNIPMVMKTALDRLQSDSNETGDNSMADISKYEKVEVSVSLCNDTFFQILSKKLGVDNCNNYLLSVPQYSPDLQVPTLMLGEIVISVETAAKQAERTCQTLLDEVRLLVVRGLLHLVGFNHETSGEAATEIEEHILKSLMWNEKGLAKTSHDLSKGRTESLAGEEVKDGLRRARSLRFYKPKFKYIFCDMDGTLLNSQSQVTAQNAEALREARTRGIHIVIATGKARPAVIDALNMVGLAGQSGIVSESSPGIFLQGLLVYGLEGRQLYKRNLDKEICREALLYSLQHKIPVVVFSQDQCYSVYDDPLVDSLHYMYHEPKAQIVSSIDQLLGTAEIQKILFLETPEKISSALRPYWTNAIERRARVVQAQTDMLEIVPLGSSKGDGVKILLDHLSISPDEVMAIGDGENDIEMLQLAAFGVALANGCEKTKAVANAVGATNDDDGVAQAIYEYAF
ncbi:unnamed protein product [Urochloa humidicola]